jgi:hypothetical protein
MPTMKAALLCSLGLLWSNFLLTSRWADVAGSLNGPKRPFVALALVVATAAVLMARRRPGSPQPSLPASPALPRLAAASGIAALIFTFFSWFPVNTWHAIPFLDDWPIRFHAALDMMRMLDAGSLTGWEWRFLGGYHSSSDATQGLGTLTYLPMKLFGPALGFHLAHVALFAAVPAVVWWDLRQDPARDARVTSMAVGFAALFACGYGYTLVRSGDTNSLGGVVMAMVAIAGAHAARLGRPSGATVLVTGAALTAYAHPGFFVYCALYLGLDAVLARDRGSIVRTAIAIVTGLVASLPLTWESWRYPALFRFNNVVYTDPPFVLGDVLRSLYYSVELLWQPGRWFNDYTGLALVFVPVVLAVAWRDRSRVRFYAWSALLTLLIMRFVNVHTGYAFLRPMHLLPVAMAVVLSAVTMRYSLNNMVRWSLVGVVALYVQVWAQPVPHVTSIRDFDRELVDRVQAAPGALVLVENNPHRNMNADPGGSTERSRFGTHFEPMLADATGRRLFSGGYSDGWQWNPWKGRVLAGGTFMGRSIDSTPIDDFVEELRRWGVVDLFVWSETSNRYLARDPRFTVHWRNNAWTGYRLAGADPREVETATGSAELLARTPFGATVALRGVRSGTPVVVRTNPHPAWSAEVGGRAVPLGETHGQLSFDAPCDGDCDVSLEYPRRLWLWPLAALALMIGIAAARRSIRPQ